MLPHVGIETWPLHNLWFYAKRSPFLTNLTFTCKTETLGSLYSHALLIIAKSSQFLKVQKPSGAWTEV